MTTSPSSSAPAEAIIGSRTFRVGQFVRPTDGARSEIIDLSRSDRGLVGVRGSGHYPVIWWPASQVAFIEDDDLDHRRELATRVARETRQRRTRHHESPTPTPTPVAPVSRRPFVVVPTPAVAPAVDATAN